MKSAVPTTSTCRLSACLLSLLILLPSGAGYSDDTDLVRSNTAKPYVLVILDTSDSMNLELGTGRWHPLNGDYEESKIFRAKRALYEVFLDVNNVNFGFMTFDHNEMRVPSKHWLYGLAEPLTSPWPLLYPALDTNGSVDASDDVLTVGAHLAGVPGASPDGSVAASCNDPLDIADPIDRAKINRFAKLGAAGLETTTLWISQPASFGNNSTEVYRLQVSAPQIAAGNEFLGDPTLTLELAAVQVSNCNATYPQPNVKSVEFRLLGSFLMADAGNRFDDGGKRNDEEGRAGFWGWQDAQSVSSCSEKSPFSGKGLESNYDDPAILSPFTPAGFTPTQTSLLTGEDEHCVSGPAGSACNNLKFATRVDPVFPEFRELDRGDFIPYHWSISARNEFLRRLNPKHSSGDPPDYGVASYFTDTFDPNSQTLALRNPQQKPLIATGPTPFGKAVNDYRCWYLGPNVGPSGKCRDGNAKLSFETGWQQVAEDRDPDFVCRRPYVILISDGEDTCGGENVSADINDFDNRGVRTWILNVGGDRAEQRFRNILANANAELINVNQGDQLADELRDILGQINSDIRSFATAAVPSVQTEADDKILLTTLNPLEGSSIWAGKALAFLKPLPVQEDPAGSGRFVPDTTVTCDATRTSECFLWDAGEVLKSQINGADPVGPAPTQRRVYYPRFTSGYAVPQFRQELEGSTASGAASVEELDLWRGLGVTFVEGDTASEENARADAKAVLDQTYSLKTARLDPTDAASEITFVLGDTFHADPLIVGGPTSNLMFSQDFEGYRDFALRHRFRRKMFVVGANDGMLHFFDAGVARVVVNEVEFDNGTGKEITAFTPRSILPKLKPMAEGSDHLWSVDGNVAVADVHIDAAHNGTPVAADRDWRTVLIAGLRRGGESVYALDITQPDELEEKTLPGPPAQTVIVPKNPGPIADCHDRLGNNSVLTCDPELKFLSPLWEFRDTVVVDAETYRLDEDDNGEFDLASTWSKPNLGRIQVDEGGTVVDKFVAIFGGGLDPEIPDARGDWLYIVDIETGRAIYKQHLKNPYDASISGGAAASEPAAVDTNQDGLIDRVYIGTTGGFMYRVDLGPDVNGDPPVLASYPLLIEVAPGQFKVAPGVQRITAADRQPRVIFDNLNSATNKRLPFYFRPSVVFSPLLAPSYTLAVGDGDRENLWSIGMSPGRFYVFAEDTDLRPGIITAAQLEPAPVGLTVGDFLFSPRSGNRNGWVLELAPDERVVSDAFALAGITVFTTYTPEDPDTAPDPNGGGQLCSRKGNSKVFAVLTTNANGVLFDANNNRTRSTGVNTLIGAAFADLYSTKNEPPSGTPSPHPPDELPPNRQLIFDELKKLFPSNCRFANYRIDIRAMASDTQVVEVAPVPVCVVQKNWREF